jgi:hypothetical protein
LKLIKKESYADGTVLGRILKGETSTGYEFVKDKSEGKQAVVEETNSTDGISSEEEDFMNSL